MAFGEYHMVKAAKGDTCYGHNWQVLDYIEDLGYFYILYYCYYCKKRMKVIEQ